MAEKANKGIIYIIDDEKNILRMLEMVLVGEGYEVRCFLRAEEALEVLERELADLILMDIRLPGMDGIEALEELRRRFCSEEDKELLVPVIMISGHGTIQDAVRAVRLGADDFLEKPLDRERVIISVQNSLKRQGLKRKVQILEAMTKRRPYRLIGESPCMKKLFSQIEKLARTKTRVLIIGESGTGKELIARAIHELSSRANKPFVKVNCAAIPNELIESELFGHEKGAFTGATIRRRGRFEQANQGTIFLDEIGDMSLNAQAKVLRIIETGELVRVGGEQTLNIDVRIIAATNKDLEKEVKSGKFREDLFFRLNVVPIYAPPLRKHPEDIPLLVHTFIKEFCEDNGFKIKVIEDEVIERFKGYSWPGNVRELRNIVERMVILSGERITLKDLQYFRTYNGKEILPFYHGSKKKLREVREEIERRYILDVLEEYNWNISKAASVLGIERTNLHKKIRVYNIERS
jgi:DNA-binding NtrC family response regulator